MSKKCPFCGSIRIVETPKGDASICLACETFLNTINGKSKPTLFDHITTSPEVLAEKLVYCEKWTITSEHPEKGKEHEYWSTPFVDNLYPTKEQAIQATVAKLKEVAE